MQDLTPTSEDLTPTRPDPDRRDLTPTRRARGNAQAPIYDDDADRRRFLDLLWRTVERWGWLCHAYCLMGNHYHLVVETPAANLGRGMRDLNGMYTQAFNRRHGRPGHVFQGRYHAVLVERLTRICSSSAATSC